MPSATGQAISLCYGYQWATGTKLQGRTLLNTGNDDLEFSRVGCWGLGEGEWDGLEELWDIGQQRLIYTSENDAPTKFHFHRGCDSVIGSGMAPTSSGPDQGVDTLFSYIPAGVQPNCYNRIANYWWHEKLLAPGVKPNDPADYNYKDASSWKDLEPLGLWRALRIRLFTAQGQMEGYAFSTNTAWQIVDAILRRELLPEYNIDLTGGIDDLPAAVSRRIDWPSFYDTASYFDAINPASQRKNYEGNFSFTQTTTLQAILSAMYQSCRSFQVERNGQIGIRVDKGRQSVFTVSRKNLLSFTPTEKDLSTAANRTVGKFRDILIPAINGTIQSIVFPDHGSPQVSMDEPHPLAAGDRIVIGGTQTAYDAYWYVDTVPSGSAVYTFTLKSRGSNYPANVGVGGKVGLTYSRFKERSPEWNHHRNQYARGAIGVGIRRQRKKVKSEIDFATSTFDQVSRVSKYELARSLGADAVPYITPKVATAELDLFAVDAAGTANRPVGIDPGDRITVDEYASVTYQGDYEVLDVEAVPDQVQQGGAVQAGRVRLSLGPYSESNFVDAYDPSEAGWVNVPGSDPGSVNGGYTSIDLADGVAGFSSGINASGTTIPIPGGFNPDTFMGWATAVGFVEADHQLHVFRNCDFDSNRILSCIYSDGNKSDSNLWTGDNGYGGLVTRSLHSVSTSTIGTVTYTELTLSGGEKVVFGSGLVPGGDSYTVQFPSGYSRANSVCLAFIKDGVETGDHNAHGFRAYVDTAGLVHSRYEDGDGNVWRAGLVRLFVFAWQNNGNTVADAGGGWKKIPLASGKTLAWAGFETYDPGLSGSAPPNHSGVTIGLTTLASGAIPLPTGFNQSTLQTLSGPTSFQVVDHPTHGIRQCYIDHTLTSLSSFEDGEGHVWYGTAGAFVLLCDMV